MASYGIQFQKGLSLTSFLESYGTEDQCREALIQSRWPNGFECPECGSRRHCILARRLFQCLDCHHQTSPTAGTIFQDTKLPLKVWFLAMHLLTQGKHSVSALELKRQLGVHYEVSIHPPGHGLSIAFVVREISACTLLTFRPDSGRWNLIRC